MKFVTALNAIGSQPWAAFLILAGASLVLFAAGNAAMATLGASVAGAGVNMFTTSLKSQTPGAASDHASSVPPPAGPAADPQPQPKP